LYILTGQTAEEGERGEAEEDKKKKKESKYLIINVILKSIKEGKAIPVTGQAGS
jgi:hypothetical protein